MKIALDGVTYDDIVEFMEDVPEELNEFRDALLSDIKKDLEDEGQLIDLSINLLSGQVEVDYSIYPKELDKDDR
jgi:hypothetical protein